MVNGAIRANASEARSNCYRLNIPVANTFSGKGVILLYSSLALWYLQQRDYTAVLHKYRFSNCTGYDLIEYSLNMELRYDLHYWS